MSSIPNITIVTPEKNNADGWNAAIKDGAEKAGVELPLPGANRITEVPDPAKKDGEPEIYRTVLEVGGKEMVFEGKDAAEVLTKYSIAVEASRLAAKPAPVAAVVEEPKPKFTDAEMLDLKIKLQTGDTSALDTYIDQSGLFDRLLEKRGIKIEDLKAATTATQSNELQAKWAEATTAFNAKVKSGESDYVAGEQNTQLMGFMIAAMNLGDKPSVDSFEKAWSALKEKKLFFPSAAGASTATTAETTTTVKKEATSSTAVGSHGGKQDLTPAAGAPTGKVELDTTKLSIRDAAESWNELIRRGYKPEQIVVKQ